MGESGWFSADATVQYQKSPYASLCSMEWWEWTNQGSTAGSWKDLTKNPAVIKRQLDKLRSGQIGSLVGFAAHSESMAFILASGGCPEEPVTFPALDVPTPTPTWNPFSTLVLGIEVPQ